MKKNTLIRLSNVLLACPVIAACVFTACAERKENRTGLDHCPVVASLDDTGGNPVTIVDFSLIKDSVTLPVSLLIEKLEIVQLENSDEALTGSGRALVTDNYIGIYSFDAGYKLYNREGKYLATIGKRGQGPYEYFSGIYDSFIDEEQELIYLLATRTNRIWVFDLEGKPSFYIPLSYAVHKGRFRVNKEQKEIELVVLPFDDTPSVAWTQDFEGNIIREIPAGNFVIHPGDYSNDVLSSMGNTDIDFSTLYAAPRADTLYHYQPVQNRLVPQFTVDFGKEIPRHYYTELPGYFRIDFAVHHHPGESHDTPSYIIDKKTFKGAKARWVFDELGGISGEKWTWYNREYLVNNIYPHNLKKQLAQKLKNPEHLSPEEVTKLKELYLSIGEDDNNILLVGKLRQNSE